MRQERFDKAIKCFEKCYELKPKERSIKESCAAEPLPVRLALGDGTVSVVNPVRPRLRALPSAGVGLANLDERCRLLTGRALTLSRPGGDFEVRVHLMAAA